jgi:Fe-S-cluster containining protein
MNKLDHLYKYLPDVKCKGLCSTQCTVIPVSNVERARIKEDTGEDKFRDWQQFFEDYKALGSYGLTPSPDCLKCPHLNENKRCDIYDIRPLICRLYGVIKSLKCPHGCLPNRWLKERDAKKLIEKLGD